MRITILQADNANNIDTTTLLSLSDDNRDKELLGQLATERNATFNPDRISHIIKNIWYNAITMTLDCDIECLTTPYGNQLKILLDRHSKKIKFIPIYVYAPTLKLYTVNAVIQQGK